MDLAAMHAIGTQSSGGAGIWLSCSRALAFKTTHLEGKLPTGFLQAGGELSPIVPARNCPKPPRTSASAWGEGPKNYMQGLAFHCKNYICLISPPTEMLLLKLSGEWSYQVTEFLKAANSSRPVPSMKPVVFIESQSFPA